MTLTLILMLTSIPFPTMFVPQAISVLRAKLSGGWYPATPSETNDQNILLPDNQTPNLVPSEGYTYPRNPAQVRAGCRVAPNLTDTLTLGLASSKPRP